MQFRYLHTRIVAAFVLLLVIVEGAGFVLIDRKLASQASTDAEHALASSDAVLRHVRQENVNSLTVAARILSADFGFRQAAATRDQGTILSALQNQTERADTDLALFADPDGRVLASTLQNVPSVGQPFPFPHLIEVAARDRLATGIVFLDGKLYELVVVPVLAPINIGWLVRGSAIDDKFVAGLKLLEPGIEISYLARSGAGARWVPIASTLNRDEQFDLVAGFTRHDPLGKTENGMTLTTRRDEYRSNIFSPDPSNEDVVTVLASSLSSATAALHRLQWNLLALGLGSLLATALAGYVIGRGITRPVTRLSEVARRLGQGDYSQIVELQRRDEIGALSSAFNNMQAAIAKREGRIRDLAFVDSMTGLPNRTAFLEALERAIREAAKSETPVTVLIMDIDRFKEVNDTLGHPMGDLLLAEVGTRLAVVAAQNRLTAARLGGDEFALLIPHGSIGDGQALAEEVARVLSRPVLLDTLELVATFSIGMAEFPTHAEDMNSLLQHAEVAMYSAKRSSSGHGVYDPRTHLQSQERLALMTDLHHAVVRNELQLYYQPKVDIATGQIGELEALVRWNHPVRGLIPPTQFIGLAEYTGQIRVITPWVIEEALRQAGIWRERGLELCIAVNVSARDLADPALPQMISELVKRAEGSPNWLALEITESGIMADPIGAQYVIESLNGMGFSFAIDDFGTGYSSLSYLKRLPVTDLKIDKSFVIQMATDSDDATIVRSTVRLGHDMGLRVTAEGIEDQTTYKMLADYGCDLAQGYFIARPQKAIQLEKWLEEAPWRTLRLHPA